MCIARQVAVRRSSWSVNEYINTSFFLLRVFFSENVPKQKRITTTSKNTKGTNRCTPHHTLRSTHHTTHSQPSKRPKTLLLIQQKWPHSNVTQLEPIYPVFKWNLFMLIENNSQRLFNTHAWETSDQFSHLSFRWQEMTKSRLFLLEFRLNSILCFKHSWSKSTGQNLAHMHVSANHDY